MKKKQRCLFKRFAALVAALILCSSLCVPAFASTNASTKKWYITEEINATTESGSSGKFFRVTPYVGGNIYAATFETVWASTYFQNVTGSGGVGNTAQSTVVFATPINYPDWWRSSLPLGAYSYITFDNVCLLYSSVPSSSVCFYLYDRSFAFDLTQSNTVGVSPSYDLTSHLFAYPIVARHPHTTSDGTTNYDFTSASSIIRFVGNSSDSLHLIQNCTQLVFSPQPSYGADSTFLPSLPGMGFSASPTLYNLSSDNLVIICAPYVSGSLSNYPFQGRIRVSAEVSFYIDATKLPAGLKVGDEFPADTDAFDQLRDDLIEQFPEASDNIENGKDTIQGWNDTETVDTDVASTSISALNAMFQNLGGFLLIVSLMVFGAVVLRMLIRKAVDG